MEILPGLHFMERGFLNANHLLWAGEKPVLVDSGYVTGLSQTLGLIRQAGLEPGEICLIVNTHTHCDHMGGNHAIQSMAGCEIALHEIGFHFIANRDRWSTWWDHYRQEADFFRPTRMLCHGDQVMIGPYRFTVLHTPGHASDGICLYQPENKILVSSDTLWEKDVPVMTPRVEGSACAFWSLKSLDLLEGLDVDMVYPGHGPPFEDFAEALALARKRYQGYLASPKTMAWDQIKRIFIYTIMMLGQVTEDRFRNYVANTPWFRETVELYFDSRYGTILGRALNELQDRGLVHRDGDELRTIIKP